MKLSQNFDSHEFDSPDLPGSGINMNLEFINKLQQARTFAGIPFIITSGYRTETHNKTVKGVQNSAHLSGKAADIHIQSSQSRFLIINSLIKAGFNRIGIYKSFIHVDYDSSKPQKVIFGQ